MQVLFPPSYACYLPSRCCAGGCLCRTMWLAIALYQVVGNVVCQVVGQCAARRECKCFSSLFVWPGPLPLMKSKYRKSRHIHCNIFHTFATNVGDILKVLVKSYFIFGKKCIQIRFHYDYLSRAVSPLKVILHRYNTIVLVISLM